MLHVKQYTMKFGKYRIIPLSDVVFNNPPSSSFNFQKERDICDFIMTCNQHIDQVYNSSSLQQNESTPLSFITTLQTYLKDSPPVYHDELQALHNLLQSIYNKDIRLENEEIQHLICSHRHKFSCKSNISAHSSSSENIF
jgi:hypothetical protein